jgi:hypothetical protein
MPPNYK